MRLFRFLGHPQHYTMRLLLKHIVETIFALPFRSVLMTLVHYRQVCKRFMKAYEILLRSISILFLCVIPKAAFTSCCEQCLSNPYECCKTVSMA